MAIGYGRSSYGRSPYGRSSVLVGVPTVQQRDPASDATDVAANTLVRFNVIDLNNDLDPTSVVITLNSLTAYENEIARNGHTVTRTPLVNGYRYKIKPPTPFRYLRLVTVEVVASDLTDNLTTATWEFTVERSPYCFGGDLNDFEKSLLDRYNNAPALLYHSEQLRSLLLESAVRTPDPLEAVRNLFLRAHSTELGTVLRDIVPTPTETEKSVVLCYKRTLLQMDTDLQNKPGLLERAILELPALGLPVLHLQLLLSYLNTNEPDTRLPLACVTVFLAKALENNELV